MRNPIEQTNQPVPSESEQISSLKFPLFPLGVTATIALAALVAHRSGTTDTPSQKSDSYNNLLPWQPGQKPVDFVPGAGVSGWFNTDRDITLAGLQGNMVLLNFWATWCLPCRQEIGLLNDLQEKFGSQGLVVLSITDESAADVAPFVDPQAPPSMHISTVVGIGAENLLKEYGVERRPTMILFDREGKIIFSGVGLQDKEKLEELIKGTLQNSASILTPVSPPKTATGTGEAYDYLLKQSERPDFGIGHTEAAITAYLKNLGQRIRDPKAAPLTEEEILKIQELYEANLATSSWSGDAQARTCAIGYSGGLYRSKKFPAELRPALLKMQLLGLSDPSDEVRMFTASQLLTTFMVQTIGRDIALDAILKAQTVENSPLVKRELLQTGAYIKNAPQKEWLDKLLNDDHDTRYRATTEALEEAKDKDEITRVCIIIALKLAEFNENDPKIKQYIGETVQTIESLTKPSILKETLDKIPSEYNTPHPSDLVRSFIDFQKRWDALYRMDWIDIASLETLFNEIQAVSLRDSSGHLMQEALLKRWFVVDVITNGHQREALSRNTKGYSSAQLTTLFLNEHSLDWFYDYKILFALGQTGVAALSHDHQTKLLEAVQDNLEDPEVLRWEKRYIALLLQKELGI